MPARLATLHNEDIDPRRDLAQRMFLRADQRGDGHAVLLAQRDHRGRGDAQRVGDQPDGMAERDVEHRERQIGIEGRRRVAVGTFRGHREMVTFGETGDERAMLGGHLIGERGAIDPLRTAGRKIFRDQHV